MICAGGWNPDAENWGEGSTAVGVLLCLCVAGLPIGGTFLGPTLFASDLGFVQRIRAAEKAKFVLGDQDESLSEGGGSSNLADTLESHRRDEE